MSKTNSSRVCIRLPCELPAEIHFSGGGRDLTKKAVISNISTTGVQILSPSFIATGQSITATFKIPGRISKSIIQAEVMRVESLQRKTQSLYPYALGAKFIRPDSHDEKKISGFISKRLSFYSQRLILAALLTASGLTQTAWILIQSTSKIKPLANISIPWAPFNLSPEFFLHPWIHLSLGLGAVLAGALTLFNHKRFLSQAQIWTKGTLGIQGVLLFFCFSWLQTGQIERLLWLTQLALVVASFIILAVSWHVEKQIRKVEKVLHSEKIYPGQNKPTFTIL